MNSMSSMSRFNDELADALGSFHSNVVYQLKTAIHPTLKHNHVPVRFVVDNCEYCQKYGNCFSRQHQGIQEP